MPLSKLREVKSWVLLGEPGSGKSTAFAEECEKTGGKVILVSDFDEELVDLALEPVIYLDALDEARNTTNNGRKLLRQIAKKLKQLDRPPFRISCRAADWYGELDHAELKRVDPELKVFRLDELSIEDEFVQQYIAEALDSRTGNMPAEEFLNRVKQQNLQPLLSKPLLIKLLIEAIHEKEFPESRRDLFELAAAKLAKENDKHYQKYAPSEKYSTEKIVDRAGYLCSIMLFSNRVGFALSDGNAHHTTHLQPDELDGLESLSLRALRSALFHPSNLTETVEPFHRTVAEFLAAQWIAKQIEQNALPIGRVLRLFEGFDKKTVSSLRGLFAWVATLSLTAFQRMVEIDPLAIAIYGDATCLSTTQKKEVILGLQKEAQAYFGFNWQVPFKSPPQALWDQKFESFFVENFRSASREKSHQAFIGELLDILKGNETSEQLAFALENIIADHSFWERIRSAALDVLLATPGQQYRTLKLLNQIATGEINDSEDSLLGALLEALYPENIGPSKILDYLHRPKNPNLFGAYVFFWHHQLSERTTSSDLSILLDELANTERLEWFEGMLSLKRLIGQLVVRALNELGDEINDDKLFSWLGIGGNKYGGVERNTKDQQQIADWFSERPKRYLSFVSIAAMQASKATRPRHTYSTIKQRISGSKLPTELGVWHLNQAQSACEHATVEIHLEEAIHCLYFAQGDEGLSLEMIENFSRTHPAYQNFINSFLVQERSDAERELAHNRSAERSDAEKKRLDNTETVTKYLDEIKAGTASLGIFYNLAIVWNGVTNDVEGSNPQQRFDSFFLNSAEIYNAALTGFQRFVQVHSLPDYTEIIELYINNKRPWIQFPTIVGLEALFENDASAFNSMDEVRMKSLVATQLSYGLREKPKWLAYVANSQPQLVSEVWAHFVSACFKKGLLATPNISEICDWPEYRAVAMLGVTKALESYPAKGRTEQLNALRHLLYFAMNNLRSTLLPVVRHKLKRKSLDAGQRVYWVMAGLAVNPTEYETLLIAELAGSAIKIHHFTQFIGHDPHEKSYITINSAKFLARLIEAVTPQADPSIENTDGLVSSSGELWWILRRLITQLGESDDPNALTELRRLQQLPELEKIHFLLEHTAYDVQIRVRETSFEFLKPKSLIKVLKNGEPVDVKDLQQLIVEHLDDYAKLVHTDNTNIYTCFWNTHEQRRPKDENDCRNFIVRELKGRLSRHGVECAPEVQYVNNKRADIRASFSNKFSVPIEFKCNWNPDLWTALRNQLINKYSIEPNANGHGIYVVLWFGKHNREPIPNTRDSSPKPQTPAQIEKHLLSLLNPEEKQRILVRVINLEWTGA